MPIQQNVAVNQSINMLDYGMRNRIKDLRQRANLTQPQLAEAAGTSNQQISKLESGKAKLTVDWMVRLAKPLGVAPKDLMTEDDRPAGLPAYAVPLPATDPTDRIPIVGGARGGDTQTLFFDQGSPIQWIPRPAALIGVPNAFAVFIVGDSMEPKFEAGAIAHVHPTMPVVAGKFVIVELDEHRAIVKKLIRMDDRRLVLAEFKPEYREFEIVRDEVKSVYRIVSSDEP